jgi:hypothetical protein
MLNSMGAHDRGERVLPTGTPVIGVPSRDGFGGGLKLPRSYAALKAAGLLAPTSDPWKFFDRKERTIAEFLLGSGIAVRSVSEDSLPAPDAVIDMFELTTEFKTLDPAVVNVAGALYQRIRQARTQSSRVIVDVRGTAATRKDANQGVVRALRNGGRDLAEVVVVGDGFVLSWP